MENVVLVVHLLLALALIGVVLLQRSEGGGLGMGGGGAMTGRAAATALGKVTWALAAAFIATSITMTVIAAQKAGSGSVVDRVADVPAPEAAPVESSLGEGGLLPPTAEESAPLVPTLPAADVPAAVAPEADPAGTEPATTPEAAAPDAQTPAPADPATEAPPATEPAAAEPTTAPATPATSP